MPTCEFIYDFGSPNVYMAWKCLPAIEEKHGVTFSFTPVLLGGVFKATGNQAPMMAFGGCPNKIDYIRLEMTRFIKANGLTKFQMNPHFPVNTLLAMRGVIAAERAGVLDTYLPAMMAAMWEDGKNVGDRDVFAGVLNDASLDAAAILEATQDPDVKAVLANNSEEAVKRGVFGAPSFFVGTELFFGKDHMAVMEAEIEAQKAKSAA